MVERPLRESQLALFPNDVATREPLASIHQASISRGTAGFNSKIISLTIQST